VSDAPPLSRRHFLRRLGFAVGTTLGLRPLTELAAVAAPAPLHVVIAGAGLAGLCAALELERRGHTCTILEAETRHVGGRVRTLRLGDGLHGEAGAMRVPKGHALTRHYVAELGLSLRPFVQSNPEAFVFARGQRERIRDAARLGVRYTLSAAEQGKSPDDLWAGSLLHRLKMLSDAEREDLRAAEPHTPTVRALDRQSLRQVLEAEGLSAEAIELLAVGAGIEPLLDTAVTEHLREEHEGVWSQGFDEIVGGTDRLPAAMAARLRSKPRMGCEVIRLEQDPLRRRAAAVYREAGRVQRVEGDFLLCTLPFPVLARVEVVPEFSGAKRRAIRELHYDSSTKILAVAGRRFWEQDEGIFGGISRTDQEITQIVYPSTGFLGRKGILIGYYHNGAPALAMGARPPAERLAAALDQGERLHPQYRSEFESAFSVAWHRVPWSAGGWAQYTPELRRSAYPVLLRPDRRLYLAGDHLSYLSGWMCGAFESARMVATAIHARSGDHAVRHTSNADDR